MLRCNRILARLTCALWQAPNRAIRFNRPQEWARRWRHMARRPTSADVPPATSLGPLAMIFRAAAQYRGMIVLAGLSLLITAAATLGIPAAFRLIIDRGFAAGADPAEIGRWFRYLFMIVVVLAVGTACRFYFVSLLGERVVADIRLGVQGNLLRLSPGFFEENSPSEISTRMTADTAQIEQVVGTTISVALRNAIMAVCMTLCM